MNWYLEVLRKYAVFTGRARRMEYWMFVLVTVIITLLLTMIDGALGLYDVEAGVGVLSGIYGLAVLVPSIAVGVRRLHDTDRSGWWLLLGLIPLLGAIALIVLLALDGTPGDNRYGPNPKAAPIVA
jgi:uncharacterized membrane protein YhaH (DUF805 family)